MRQPCEAYYTVLAVKHVVVIGASAGGIETLRTLVGALPGDFGAPICIVLHTSPTSPGVLGDILNRSGPLTAVTPRSGERLKPGIIYVAPPDCHMLLEPGIVRLTKGPKENRFRPAIDPLFRSAAQIYGPNVIGVILTGNLDDGTAGLWAVKQLGGVAIVQDPEDALFPAMPENALQSVRVDHVVPLSDIAPLLRRLTSVPAPAEVTSVPETVEVEVKIAKEQDALDAGIERIAKPSRYSCPECHGVLLEINEGGPLRFRCHTGHAYSVESLLSAIHDGVEETLWESVRASHEAERLMQEMARHLESAGHADAQAKELTEGAREMRRRSDVIREMLAAREEIAAPKA